MCVRVIGEMLSENFDRKRAITVTVDVGLAVHRTTRASGWGGGWSIAIDDTSSAQRLCFRERLVRDLGAFAPSERCSSNPKLVVSNI